MRSLVFPLALSLALSLPLVSGCTPSTPDLFGDEAPDASRPASTTPGAHDRAPAQAPQEARPALRPSSVEGVDMPDPAQARGARERVHIEPPSHWREEPPSSTMRAAQWVVPGDPDAELADAECVLFHFPGGGGAEDNLFRWIAQFEQPDGSSSEGAAERAELPSPHATISLVKVQGTYLEQFPPMSGPIERREGFGLIGAVLEFPAGDPWFLKCTGPAPVIDANEGAIVHFLQHFRLQG